MSIVTRHTSFTNHTKYWLALAKIGIGFQTVRKLLHHFQNVEGLWHASEVQLRTSDASPEFVRKFITARNGVDPDPYLESIQHPDVTIIPLPDPSYPLLLREIHSPPLVLFVSGDIRTLSTTCLTVVGTRTPTSYGLRATRLIVEPLARQGITIVSGLAYGIDAEAHRAALSGGGKTIAVLGSGVDVVYPRGNRALAEAILNEHGALISEYPPGTEPQKHFFPQRNRIMAGMSSTALIVEAGAKSGALLTARFALEENREVFAVPGPIDSPPSEGPNNLLKMGASVATSADDLRSTLGLDIQAIVPENTPISADSEAEATLLPLLNEARHVDELVAMSTLDTSVVNATLSVLEMKGRVRHLGGMHYVRVS